MGPSGHRSLSHILCLISSLKYLDNSIWWVSTHFVSCFADAKTTTKWKKLATWWPWTCSPQTYWPLKIDNVNSCNTILLPHHQPTWELRTSWLTYPGTPSSPSLPWNSLGNLSVLSTICLGLIWKDPDARKYWRQEEKGTTQDEMVGWHHWLNGYEFG